MAKLEIKGLIIPSGDQWVYDWLDIPAVSPLTVSNALEKAAGQPVTVEINSPGGSLDAGVEIYTALRSYHGGVRIQVMAYAGSAASVIAMAGESEISPAARLMIHNVSTRQEGDHRAMEHTAEILRKADRAIAAVYIDKTGLPESEILDMLGRESTFTAEEAVEKGFIDRIMFQSGEHPAQALAASYGGLLPSSAIERVRDLLGQKKNADLEQARAELEFLHMKGK